MKTKTQKYKTEMEASDAAHLSHTRNIKTYGEDVCKMILDNGSIVLERPDTFEGTIRVRYEWKTTATINDQLHDPRWNR